LRSLRNGVPTQAGGSYHAGVANQWHFEPDTYLAMVRSEIPTYDELQRTLAEATRGLAAERILDLGSGTGVTARAVLAVHPQADLVGVDGSDDMLVHARRLVPGATFVVGELEAPLPPGPFDLVVSAFAVHHLDGPGKAALFQRIAAALAPGGRFVLCDVVVAQGPVDHPVPLEDGVDLPSRVEDQLAWLGAAGLHAAIVHADGDLAVLTAERPGRAG
jgi:tRNA (cmo5U34)-methyltransferase